MAVCFEHEIVWFKEMWVCSLKPRLANARLNLHEGAKSEHLQLSVQKLNHAQKFSHEHDDANVVLSI